MSVGWERKTEFVPASMVRNSAVERIKGLVADPMLPAAVRARLLAVMAAEVRVVVMAPLCAVRVRLVVGRVMAEVIEILPVVCTREREPAVPTSGR